MDMNAIRSVRGIIDYEPHPEYCGYRIRFIGECEHYNSGWDNWDSGHGLLRLLANGIPIGAKVEISIRVIDDNE